jgi:hypothetical protein
MHIFIFSSHTEFCRTEDPNLQNLDRPLTTLPQEAPILIMEERRHSMKKRPDKRIATALAFLIVVLPAALSAREKRGAELVITLKDGHYTSGELIAVKPDSLLLLAGKDESVDLVGIRSIRIVRRSKAGLGAAYGALAGGLILGLIAALDPCLGSERPITAGIIFGAIGAIPGGLIGLGAGSLAGKDKIIQLEGKSESEVRMALAYLRGKARIRDYK